MPVAWRNTGHGGADTYGITAISRRGIDPAMCQSYFLSCKPSLNASPALSVTL